MKNDVIRYCSGMLVCMYLAGCASVEPLTVSEFFLEDYPYFYSIDLKSGAHFDYSHNKVTISYRTDSTLTLYLENGSIQEFRHDDIYSINQEARERDRQMKKGSYIAASVIVVAGIAITIWLFSLLY